MREQDGTTAMPAPGGDATPTLACGQCPTRVPAMMDMLLEHARAHGISVADCFPLEWSPEASRVVAELLED